MSGQLTETRLAPDGEVQDQSQDHEDNSNPLGGLCQLSIGACTLILGHKGFGIAGNGTETGTLAGLSGDDQDQQQCENNLNNGQNSMNNSHDFLQSIIDDRSFGQRQA